MVVMVVLVVRFPSLVVLVVLVVTMMMVVFPCDLPTMDDSLTTSIAQFFDGVWNICPDKCSFFARADDDQCLHSIQLTTESP
jgi:hypothetical protein